MQNRLLELLNNDDVQNMFLPAQVRSKMTGGDPDARAAADWLGTTQENAIPVNGVIGELTYLSRLLTSSGVGFFFHRLGSVPGPRGVSLDAYEIVSFDGAVWDVLYMDMYSLHKTTRAPKGFALADRAEGLSGVNWYVADFPAQIINEIKLGTSKMFGEEALAPGAESADTSRFVRGDGFKARVASIRRSLAASSSAPGR